MKIKSIIIFALLFTMSFSIAHEYIFTFYDTKHCSVSEYVSELDTPSKHGDICDIHYEYHIAYILPLNSLFEIKISRTPSLFTLKKSYFSSNTLQLYRPPILAL